jgi:RecB family exonuclease
LPPAARNLFIKRFLDLQKFLMEQNKRVNSFSYSGISTFKSCPRAFKYKYIEEIQEAFTTIEGHLGSSVHAAVEWAYKQRQENDDPGTTETLDQYKQVFWNSGGLEKTRIVKAGFTTDDYFQQGKTFLSFFLNSLFPQDKSATLYLEHKFEINLADGIKYRGVIDRIAREESGFLRLIDYKTGRAASPLENFQLPSYSLYVFENNIDNEVRLCIEDLREQRSMAVSFSRGEARQVRAGLLKDIGQIRETVEFKTNPSILCRWCGYNHICESAYRAVNKPGGEDRGGEGGCPMCGGQLMKRNGKYGPFMGCSRFPQCRFTRPVKV